MQFCFPGRHGIKQNNAYRYISSFGGTNERPNDRYKSTKLFDKRKPITSRSRSVGRSIWDSRGKKSILGNSSNGI